MAIGFSPTERASDCDRLARGECERRQPVFHLGGVNLPDPEKILRGTPEIRPASFDSKAPGRFQ